MVCTSSMSVNHHYALRNSVGEEYCTEHFRNQSGNLKSGNEGSKSTWSVCVCVCVCVCLNTSGILCSDKMSENLGVIII